MTFRKEMNAQLKERVKGASTEIVCKKTLIRQKDKVRYKLFEKGKTYTVFPVCSIDRDKFWFWTVITENSPTGVLNFSDEADRSYEGIHRLKKVLQEYFEVPDDINKVTNIDTLIKKGLIK
jgi:hypothetical protein